MKLALPHSYNEAEYEALDIRPCLRQACQCLSYLITQIRTTEEGMTQIPLQIKERAMTTSQLVPSEWMKKFREK